MLQDGDTGYIGFLSGQPSCRAHPHQTGSGASGSDRGVNWDRGSRVECGGIAETPRKLVDDVVLPNSRAVYPVE